MDARMKGYLVASNTRTAFALLPKITTVGLRGCNLNVDGDGVEEQHAIIEYLDKDSSFVLSDLQSGSGTYVNNARLNGTVVLSPGDIVRFGGSVAFEFVVEQRTQIRANSRQSSLQLQSNAKQLRFGEAMSSEATLPMLNSARGRPSSTGFTEWTQTSGLGLGTTVNSPVPRLASTVNASPKGNSMSSHRLATPDATSNVGVDKDVRIAQLSTEVSRLRSLENVNQEKDNMIRSLQTQLADLRSVASNANMLTEGNLKSRKQGEDETAGSRTSSAEASTVCTFDDSGFRRSSDDQPSFLVTQLQKELGQRQLQMANLGAQNDSLKRDLRAKDVELSAIHAKLARLKDVSKYEEHMATREKEVIALRDKWKQAEAASREAFDRLEEAREELERCRNQQNEYANKCKQLEEQLVASQQLIAEAKKAEQKQHAEADNAHKAHERFRTRLIQVAFTVPQVRVPESDLSDDQLVDITRKLIMERVEALEKVKIEKSKATDAMAHKSNLVENVQKWKDSVAEAVSRLRAEGLLAKNVKRELQTLQAIVVDDSVLSMKDILMSILAVQHAWSHEMECKLEDCGINVNIVGGSHAQHISTLRSKIDALVAEKSQLQVKLNSHETRIKDELRSSAVRLQSDHQASLKEALERERLLVQDRLQVAVREAVAQAACERKELQDRLEREKADLLAKNEELRKALAQKTVHDASRVAEAENAVGQLSDLRLREQRLRDEFTRSQKAAVDESASLNEQIRQQKHTITELNERFKRLSKVCEENELQVQQLKQDRKKLEELQRVLATTEHDLNEFKNSRIDPAQLQAAEKAAGSFRLENAQLKQSVLDLQNSVESLRRDLKTAQARLSDAKSEIPESHKQELDANRARALSLEQELRSLREQLTRSASHSESALLTKSNSWETEQLREKVNSLQEQLRQKEQALQSLASHDSHVQLAEFERPLELEDAENAKYNEFAALGAQCKGERHQEIIAKQKEALNEIRNRVKVLEQLNPAAKTDTAIHQVVELKKELAELKAAKLNSTKLTQQPIHVMESLDAMLTPDAMDLHLEKQSHESTMQALQMSESCYMQLGRSVASTLTIEQLDGQKFLAHLPVEERQRVIAEREKACELLVGRIRALKETLERKDELVQEHERLLAKLRQIEEIATKRGAQVDKLLEDLRGKTEECELLRDLMLKTKDDLDIAKRLGKSLPLTSSVTARFPAESKGKSRVGGQRHERCHSPVGNEREVDDTNKKSTDRLKRKSYEIDALKRELGDREKDLDIAQHKINSLELSLGFPKFDFSFR